MLTSSRFISIEVAIRTDGECDAFVNWFRDLDNYVEMIPSERHRWHVYFAPLSSQTAAITIRNFCNGISSWPDEVRRQWDHAASREFLVGYEIGTNPTAYLDHFDSDTLELAALYGAGIGLALYPPTMNTSSDIG